MRITWLLPLLALGCASSDDEPASTTGGPDPTSSSTVDTGTSPTSDTATTEPEEPAPYILDEDEAPDVDVDLDEVGTTLQGVLDSARELNAMPVQASYDKAMEGQGDQCPYYYTTPQGTYWFDNCTSTEGTEFNGYVFAYGESDVPDGYGGLMTYWSASGAATVVDDRGNLLEIGGQAYHTSTSGPGYVSFTSVVAGTFSWEGAEADGTWMSEGVDPDFILYGQKVTGQLGDNRYMYVDGGFGGIEGGWAVAFDENIIAEPQPGVTCTEELTGTVGVRTPEGQWVDIVFDGDIEAEVDPADCDGCGAAFVQGEVVGQVCVDATSLVAWEDSPW